MKQEEVATYGFTWIGAGGVRITVGLAMQAQIQET